MLATHRRAVIAQKLNKKMLGMIKKVSEHIAS